MSRSNVAFDTIRRAFRFQGGSSTTSVQTDKASLVIDASPIIAQGYNCGTFIQAGAFTVARTVIRVPAGTVMRDFSLSARLSTEGRIWIEPFTESRWELLSNGGPTGNATPRYPWPQNSGLVFVDVEADALNQVPPAPYAAYVPWSGSQDREMVFENLVIDVDKQVGGEAIIVATLLTFGGAWFFKSAWSWRS